MQKIGPYRIYCHSIAGNESSTFVEFEDQKFTFDIGVSYGPIVQAKYVFISHGHLDHIGDIGKHMRQRQLRRLPKATYFLPACTEKSVKAICNEFHVMHGTGTEDLSDPDLISVTPGFSFKLNNNWTVRSIQTHHKIDSVGYILYKNNIPKIAYCGDTKFSVFYNPLNTDLLSVELLITECTYLDYSDKIYDKCVEYCHTHLKDFAENSKIFDKVSFIYLMHFSDRYRSNHIQKNINEWVNEEFAAKIFVGIEAKKFIEKI